MVCFGVSSSMRTSSANMPPTKKKHRTDHEIHDPDPLVIHRREPALHALRRIEVVLPGRVMGVNVLSIVKFLTL